MDPETLSLFQRRAQEFTNAAAKLNEAWEALEDQDFTTNQYPFGKSFDEFLFDVFEWNTQMQKEKP